MSWAVSSARRYCARQQPSPGARKSRPLCSSRLFRALKQFSLLAAKSVANLKLEYRVADVGILYKLSVVSRTSLERSRSTFFVYTREVTGVTQADLQAAGDLVTQATYVADYYFIEVVGAGVLRLLRIYTASLDEVTVVKYEATLRAKLHKEAFAVFAYVVAQHDGHIEVAERAFQSAATYLEVINGGTFLRVQEFRLNREVVRNTKVYETTSRKASLVFRTFRVSARESRTVKAAFQAYFDTSLSVSNTSSAGENGEGKNEFFHG